MYESGMFKSNCHLAITMFCLFCTVESLFCFGKKSEFRDLWNNLVLQHHSRLILSIIFCSHLHLNFLSLEFLQKLEPNSFSSLEIIRISIDKLRFLFKIAIDYLRFLSNSILDDAV
jgi:hypothetical protein